MQNDYYFNFDEPILYNKNIICAFHICDIERKRGFYFIVKEKNLLTLYYTMIRSSELMKFVREYIENMNLDKKLNFFDVFKIPDFKLKFNDKYLQKKVLDNQNYIMETIDKMSKGKIYNANNKIQGLDGFSVELKLDKATKNFYAWCSFDDKKYFYILDFVNSILDELEVNSKYRFEKVE